MPVPNLSDLDQAGEGPDLTSKSVVAVLRSAKELFLAHGYDGVNLDAVARNAGVARQTVYNRFGSKEAVFRSMIRWHWSFFDFEQMLAAPGLEPTSPPDTVLRHVAAIIIDFLAQTEQVAFTRLVIAESRRWPWIGEEFYQVGKRPAMTALEEQLRRMHHARTIHCPDVTVAARQFIGLIQEFLIWPHVMAIGTAGLADLPAAPAVVEEAIATFLARYGR
jgi:TetR/AcrR family transcriptional regulator of autoinduction and epiphytic fitness